MKTSRILITLAALLLTGAAYALTITTLLNAATATGVGPSVNYQFITGEFPAPTKSFQATLNGASAVSATVEIDGSNDSSNWLPVATITLSAASPIIGATTQTSYAYMRGNLLSISGTGASVTLTSGQ